MKFCDKLAKKRKERNLSQEQLADKLNMSRQAISKWESNASYPDMETIIKLCKILDCPINELLDDDALGDNTQFKSNKFNINDSIRDLLKFITKTYNMFCSMNFGEKVKCILEIIIMTFLFVLCWSIIGNLFRNFIINAFDILPENVYIVIKSILEFIYEAIGIALGFIVIIHLFKVRYLDYYITIEDTDIKTKKVEESIEKNPNSKSSFSEKQKEKIIIRDPKHTTYSFFSALGKIIMFFIKCFLIFIGGSFIVSFVILSFGMVLGVLFLKYGIIFLGILLSTIGALAINYLVLYFIYNVVFDRKNNFKMLFIVFIAGLVLLGGGMSISFNNYLSFNTEYDISKYRETITENIKMEDNLVLYFEDSNIVIDNNMEDIKMEVIEYKNFDISFYNSTTNGYKIVSYYKDESFIKSLNLGLEFLKNKDELKFGDYRTLEDTMYISEKNLNIIKNNYKELFNERDL